MTDLTFRAVPGSPYLRAALATALEKGLHPRLVPLAPGESKQPAHLARHPFGRMPHLDHDGFALYETQAILRYLDRVGTGPALTPRDPRAEARMNQIIGICDWYLFPTAGAGIAFNRVVAPRFGFPVDEAAVAAAVGPARVAVGALAALQDGAPFLAGAAPSLADLHLLPHMDFLARSPEGAEMLARHPALLRWLDAMRERPSVAATTWEAVAAMAA